MIVEREMCSTGAGGSHSEYYTGREVITIDEEGEYFTDDLDYFVDSEGVWYELDSPEELDCDSVVVDGYEEIPPLERYLW